MKFNLKTTIKTLVIIVCGLVILYCAWLIVVSQDSDKETNEQAALQSCLFTAQNAESKNNCYLSHPQFYYPELFLSPLPMVWERYVQHKSFPIP